MLVRKDHYRHSDWFQILLKQTFVDSSSELANHMSIAFTYTLPSLSLSAFLVLFAFSCGMNQLLWYYAELGTVCCHFLIITTQRVVRIL